MSRCARCDQEVTSGYVICNRCYKRMEEQVDGSRIINRIGIPAALEQLAEEAAELSQAALKLARVLRGENPTPVTRREVRKHLIEEYDEESERFRKRWEEKKAAEEKDGNRHREEYGKLYDKFLKTY